MKHNIPRHCIALTALLALPALSLISSPAQAQFMPLKTMNFQGRLANPDGTPLSVSSANIAFSIWDSPTVGAGTQLWAGNAFGVAVNNGTFAAKLDFTTGFVGANTIASVFGGSPIYLQIAVNGAAPLSPRQPFVANAYAILAGSALTVPDGSITSSKFAPNLLNPLAWLLGGNSGTNPASNFLGTTDSQPLAFRTGNVERMRLLTNGFVGVGRTTQITGADYFGVNAPVSNGFFGGMYVNTDGAKGLPFYGYAQGGSAVAYHYIDGGDGNKWKLVNGSATPLTVTPSGNVGIGTTSPSQMLDVAGTMRGGGDFILNGRGGGFGYNFGNARALVDGGTAADGVYGGGLIINFENDYGKVLIQSPLDVSNTINVANGSVNGALGTTVGKLATGIYGAFGSSTSNYGVRGEVSGAAHTNGFSGVSGRDNDSGNFGQLGGPSYGASARSVTSGGAGVYGETTASDGDGIYGKHTTTGNFGVLGRSGAGVFGSSQVGSAPGVSGSSPGNGVYGSGGSAGVQGVTVVAFGKGVYGYSSGPSAYGVYGEVAAAQTSSYGVYSNGKAGGTTNWNGASDARYKMNVVTLHNALDTVLNLRGVNYDWDRAKWPGKNFSEGRQVGFIAQEIEKFLPEVVSTDAQGYKSVAYGSVVPVLVEAVKTLNAKVDAQQREIAELRDSNAELKKQNAEIAELRKQLAAILETLKTVQNAPK